MRRLVVLLVVVLGLPTLTAAPPAAADPQPGECEALTPADIAYSAARISGQTPDDRDEFDCYVLPGSAGTTYLTNAYGGSVRATVYDADTRICTGVGPCRLLGAGPFTLRVAPNYDTAVAYRLQVIQVSGDTTCPAQPLTSFSSEAELFRARTDDASIACWSVEVPAGRLMIATGSPWTLIDAMGAPVCSRTQDIHAFAEFCDVTAAGRFVFAATSPLAGTSFTIPVIASDDTTGCEQPVRTSWAQAMVEAPAVAYRIDCRTMDASPGDRVITDARHSFTGAPRQLIINALGEEACVTEFDHLGCVLTGPAPYRLLSWVINSYEVDPDTYSVAVRSLNPGGDCPLIEPIPFGVAPDDHHPGVGCRQFDSEEGGSFMLRAVGEEDGDRFPYWTQVVDEQGRLRCNIDAPVDHSSPRACHDLPAGRYVAVSNVLYGDYVTGFYDVTETRGCAPQPAPLTAVDHAVAPGQRNCYQVTRQPGDYLGVTHPGTTGNPDGTSVFLAYPDGSTVDCDADECPPGDPRPLRLVVGDGLTQRHLFAVHHLDDLDTCTPLPPGVTSIELTASDRVRCLRLDGISEDQDYLGLRTDSPDGGFLTAAGAPGLGWCRRTSDVFVTEKVVDCSRGNGASTAYVILFGNEATQTVTAVRVPAVVTNTARPRITGQARVGRVLRARNGDWLPRPSAFTYRWSVDGKVVRGTKRQVFEVKRRHRGKSIRVTVIAAANPLRPGVATSPPRRVRR